MDPDALRKDFLLKEYDARRKELADSVAETRTLERYAAGATAAIWTWLFTQNPDKAWVILVRWIPVALCILAVIRCAALFVDILWHAKHLRAFKKRWSDPAELNKENSALNFRWYPALTAVVIWLVLVFGNIYVARNVLGWLVHGKA